MPYKYDNGWPAILFYSHRTLIMIRHCKEEYDKAIY